jgi:5'-nucleotidase
MGEDVTYSGTVSAAMEATLLGIPSVAVSLVHADEQWLEGYEDIVRRLARMIIDEPRHKLFPADTLLNINLPDRHPDSVEGVRVTSLGKRVYSDPVVVDKDPHGKTYYWIGGGEAIWEGEEGADYLAVEKGFISITPVHLDFTDRRVIPGLKKWESFSLRDDG